MIKLITGGARSGKSKFAEELLITKDDVLYIATAKVEDQEMEDRVSKHKERRPNSWGLFEGDTDLHKCVTDRYNHYLLDCVTVLCSNHLFYLTEDSGTVTTNDQKIIEENILRELESLIQVIHREKKELIIVTNEIGCGIVPMHPISRAFRDIQGRINQKLAYLSDEVYLVVSGIPVRIK